MKEFQEYEKDLASIRSMMERSVKFISLSGLSGILSGLYAVAGATIAYYLLYYPEAPYGFEFGFVAEEVVRVKLLFTAGTVLLLSIGTGSFLSMRKAKRLNTTVWNSASKQLFTDLLIPLITGGLFILVLIFWGYYLMIAPACLIFYGLALINGSRNTYTEVRSLGLIEITLGLISALIPGYSLIFWTVGFGGMHMLYGAIMHYRYDR